MIYKIGFVPVVFSSLGRSRPPAIGKRVGHEAPSPYLVESLGSRGYGYVPKCSRFKRANIFP
jgi:hypothetical protein